MIVLVGCLRWWTRKVPCIRTVPCMSTAPLRSFLLFALGMGMQLGMHAATAQDTRWRAHTSFREVNDVSASRDAIWIATTGGVFRYAPGSGEISTYTAGDGLHNVQTQAIEADPVRDVIWIGYRDGVLDRLDPETGTVRTFLDIERADRFSSREIHEIVVRGDSVYVATSFGVVLFDPVRNEIRDTYHKFGSLAAGTPVFDLVFAPGPNPNGAPTFWLATNAGVAHAPLDAVNLRDPDAWTVEASGLPVLELRSIAYFEGAIHAGTTEDLARRSEEGVYVPLGVTGRGVFDLEVLPDRLLGVSRFDPLVVSGGQGRQVSLEGYQDPVALALGPDGHVWVGDKQGGLLSFEPPEASQSTVEVVQADVYPSGPYDNLFSTLQVDDAGNLWAAGFGYARTGFYRFDPSNGWTNYIGRFFPKIPHPHEEIHVDARGDAWAGSTGNALTQVTAGGEIRTWSHDNSSLRPAAGTNDYVIVGGIASDEDGRIWVTNTAAPVPLHVYAESEGWMPIGRIECEGFSTSSATFDRIYVDSFDQQWIIVLDLANLRQVTGLLVLDHGGTPTQQGDDRCSYHSSEGAAGQGLPGLAVTSVVEDLEGVVWVGTDKGLAFMINTGVVAGDASARLIWPQFADRMQGTFVLNGIRINDLAVDPANRLWVATNEGISVVQQVEGGFEVAEWFTAGNSPLFSDVVVAVAVDPVSGRVYVATDQGLISYEGGAIGAVEQAGTLKVYPNPVHVQTDSDVSVVIEGLVEATTLRIVTIAGDVVARLQTRGGRTTWDGRDLQGRLVPSGLYLVVAVGEKGEGVSYGKVAVIR